MLKSHSCGELNKDHVGAEVTLDSGHHLTLLCKDRKGYSNLCRLLTEAHLTNKAKRPAATKEMLAKFCDGLISLSGCSKGELPTLISKGMGRGDAHEIMRKTSLKAISQNKTLKEAFIEENKKLKILTDKEINYSLKPENYLGATDKIVDRVVKRLER